MPGTESKDNKLWDKKLGKPDACRVFLHYYFLFHHFVSCIYDMYEIIQPGRMYYTSYILTCQFLNQSLPM